MTFPGGGPGGGFFEQMLRDLLKVLGGAPTGAGGSELARAMAQGVATGGGPEGNVDPVERMQFEQLANVAELHVAELTGLAPAGSGASGVVLLEPGAWATQTVDDWRFLLDAMSGPADPGEEAAPRPPTPGLGLADLDDEVDADVGTADLLARWMATMGPMMAAMQLGSAVGHLARTTLGAYEIPVPRPESRFLVVPTNVSRFAADWSLPADEVRLWVCVRELTTRAVLSRPHVAERVRELLLAVVTGMAEQSAGMMERLQELDLANPEALQDLVGDPASLAGLESSPARRRASDDLMAVVSALLGYVEHVLDQAATRLLGDHGAITEAWRRRLMDRDGAERAAEMIFGLDLGPGQIDRGSEFVRGVRDRAGEEGLARLWSTRRTLPTPAELDAPGLWLERIALDDEEGEANGGDEATPH